jgi:hypothetical protein
MSGFDDLRNRAEGTAVQPPAVDNLRQEYLRNQRPADMPLTPGTVPPAGSDQTQPRNSIYNQNFDNPINHLDRAKWYLQNEGPRSAHAMQEYYAAIRAADLIDQREVAAARKQAQDQLKTETDPTKRRQLAQWDATLHDMQRAPGFTRANLGMLWIRSGYQGDGIRLIVEAGAKDPEMRTDQNFIRHMRMLNMQMPGDGRVGPNGPNVPPGYDNRPTGVLPKPGDVSPPAPTDRTGPPTGTVRPEGQFDNPLVHLQKANQAFERTMQLTPQIRAEFAAAIKAADNLDRNYIRGEMQKLDAESKQNFDKAREDNIVKLTKERDDLHEKLAKDNPASAKKLDELDAKWGQAKTDAERKSIEAEMAKVPGADALIKKQQELDAAESDPKHQKFVECMAKIESLKQLDDSSTLTRFAYAFALNNDANQAKQVLAGNLTDGQRQALKEIAAKSTLPADQKTLLNGLADKDTLTEQDRAALKQLATKNELNAQQKAAMGKICQQFSLTDSQKTALQTLATQEKQLAAGLLDQIVKIDPNSRKDNDFVALAKDVGYNIPAEQVSDRAKDQAPTVADLTKGGHPIDLLANAHKTEKEKDFATAKPVYEQAIAAADKLDQAAIKKKVDQYTEAAKDESLNEADRKAAVQLAFEYIRLQHSPFVTRFQYAIALSNAAIDKKPGGDAAVAKTMLAKAQELDPDAAKSDLFKMVNDKINAGQKISEDDLRKFSQQDQSASNAGGGDANMQQVQASLTKFDEANKVQNAVTAEQSMKDAIAAADKVDMAPWKAKLKEIQDQIKTLPNTPENAVKSATLVQAQKGIQSTIDLPMTLRLELAKHYIRNHHPDQAKALLEDQGFLDKFPDVKKRSDYKAIKGFADEYCKSTLDKAMAWAAKEGKGLFTDFASGGAAAVIFAMNPEAGIGRRLLLSLGTAAIVKAGGQAILEGKAPTKEDALWGVVNGGMFIAGGEARSRLMNRMALGIDETVLKEQLLKSGVKDTVIKDFTLQQDMRNVDAIGKLLRQQLGEKVDVALLRQQAGKLGVSELALKELDGKTGRAAIDAWVKLLENHSVTGLDSKALLASGRTLGLDEAALSKVAADGQAQRIDTITAMLKDKLGDKVDGKKLVAHATSLGITPAEAAQLEGKTGKEAMDAFAGLLKRQAEAGNLNMAALTDKAAQLGVDKFEMTKALAIQDRAAIDAIGDVMKKDLSKVDPTKLAAEAKAMGVADAELAKLNGKTGAEAVDTFTALLKARAESGLTMAPLNDLAASMGLSQSALREITSKRRIEALEAVEKVLGQHIEDQRKLAREAYEIATKYKLDGIKEGDGVKLAEHLKRLGLPENDQMKALAAMKDAEASKTAVGMLKEFILQKEKDMGTAPSWIRNALRRAPADATAEAAAKKYAVDKKAIDELRAATERSRMERIGSWAKSYAPWVKGEEKSIYREYRDLWRNAGKMQGWNVGPLNLSYLNPNNLVNLRDNGWRVPFSFRDVGNFKSLNDLAARSFWNKYKVDWATIGLMSLMYRGAHNTANMYSPDERTGKTLTGSEALSNTFLGSAADATMGGFMMPVFRELGGAFTKSGSLAESLAPTKAPWQQIRPGVWSKLSLTWQAPTYAAENYVLRPVTSAAGRGLSYLGGRAAISPEWAAANPGLSGIYNRVPIGLSTIPSSAAIFSPRLQEIPGIWSTYSTTESILEANNRPMEDKNQAADPLDDDNEVDDKDPYKKDLAQLGAILDYLQEKEKAGEDPNEPTDASAQPAPPPPAPNPTPAPKPPAKPADAPPAPDGAPE